MDGPALRPRAEPGTISCRRRRQRRSIVGRLRAFGIAVVAFALAGQDLLRDQAGILPDRGFDLGGHVRIGLQERLGILATLTETLAVIGEPGAGLLDDP